MGGGTWRLRLAKEDFKFSVAHFTLFSAERAEPLHGHNYRMSVEVEGDSLGESGLVADTDALKAAIRAVCAGLDDRVLLPERSPWLRIEPSAGGLECRFAERRYLFPEGEVRLLPLINVSMELLARWVWDELARDLEGRGLARLAVEVEETSGQSCRYGADLSGI
ncbi:MAG TPA: 6-carboxytetrahydropterin synthase [Thermoanaerobaculia bacterium]|nr:6-carboxytetrahydropterin synthase [Thermoanaerobaculia bacterium]